MQNNKRAEQKYLRRQYKRQQRKQERANNIGGLERALSFDQLYKAGKACCKGVRWKSTTQSFEAFLLANTAKVYLQLQNGTWKPHRRHHFKLTERGKVRDIEAPTISDRQVEKALTRNVLLPLYIPQMIYNNGASLRGKGFKFSMNRLKTELHNHYRKYGRDGKVILIDFKGFFPNANHFEIYQRHASLILEDKLHWLADLIIKHSGQCGKGMPLGVEPSQAEMIALPSMIDNFIKCQLRMRGNGHYMDDYYILVPPKVDAATILNKVLELASQNHFIINRHKVRIQSLTKPFVYCKAKYMLTENGKVITSGSRASKKASRKQIYTLYKLLNKHRVTLEDIWSSVSGRVNYYNNYNDHQAKLKLIRLFYFVFKFSCNNIQNFRGREISNE